MWQGRKVKTHLPSDAELLATDDAELGKIRPSDNDADTGPREVEGVALATVVPGVNPRWNKGDVVVVVAVVAVVVVVVVAVVVEDGKTWRGLLEDTARVWTVDGEREIGEETVVVAQDGTNKEAWDQEDKRFNLP